MEIDLIGPVALGLGMIEPFESTKINVHEHKGIPPKYKLHPRMPKGLRHPTEVQAPFGPYLLVFGLKNANKIGIIN